jgi:hypothetical protein
VFPEREFVRKARIQPEFKAMFRVLPSPQLTDRNEKVIVQLFAVLSTIVLINIRFNIHFNFEF